MTKLFVGNLSYQLTEEEFRETFQSYGNIKELRLLQNKGFGFVEFDSEESAQRALEELNGKEVKGRKMRVEVAKPREPRESRESRGSREPREPNRYRSYGSRNFNSRNSGNYQQRTQRSGFSRRRES